MAEIELIMPKMGESIMEATILKWLKKEGDTVAIDEPVLEIATDKVDSEVPSPFAGKIIKLLYKEGDVVPVNKPIAVLSSDATASAPSPAAALAPKAAAPVTSATPKIVAAPASNGSSNGSVTANRFYSPLVLNIARNEGISMTELEMIPGTGQESRVTKRDLLSYVQQRKSGGAPDIKVPYVPEEPSNVTTETKPTTAPTEQPKPAGVIYGNNVEIIEMDRMRKLIADHMVMSKRTSPHVTSFVEADVTNLVQWRDKVKKEFEKREGEKLTFTPLFVEAIVKALKDFPMVNVSVDGDKIIRKKDINIGMATALPSGNLIVPVIKNADTKNLFGLAKDVNDLSARARANQLKLSEIEGGTFTFTNVGTFGNLMGTPIINQPQVAIIATGAIKKKPAVIETPQGDAIAIRHMMFLSLSYDHRVVDGALGGSFLRRVADYLEQFNVNREA